MDSVAVQASVPTFERSHRAFHRERTVTSTPCAGSFAGVTGDVAVGIFPASSLHAAPRAYKLYGRAGSWHCGSTRNLDESDAKIRSVYWAQILHDRPFFSHFSPAFAA